MDRAAAFIVKARYALLVIFLLLAGASFFMMQRVNVNSDMSRYLPDDSPMREGTDLMAEEFPSMSADSTIRIMLTIEKSERTNIKEELSAMKNVGSVNYEPDSPYYNNGDRALYVLSTGCAYDSEEFSNLMDGLAESLSAYSPVIETDEEMKDALPLYIIAGAVGILMAILIIMSNSWTEPFLFLISIGLSILINMGTNVFLPSVSKTTHSITAILQLVLAMDYSIILSNRYRQAGKKEADPVKALCTAVRQSIPSVLSSSITTIAGLLSLCFMRFKIGADLGIVLAKGVFISLLSVFMVLPALLILFDGLIRKTAKKSPVIPTGGLAGLEYKGRVAAILVFAGVFIYAFAFRNSAGITYGTPARAGEIGKYFSHSERVVLLYDNTDEEKIPALTEKVLAEKGVAAVSTYSNTLGTGMTAEELLQYVSGMLSQGGGISLPGGLTLEPYMARLLYYDHFSDRKQERITLEVFLGYVNRKVQEVPLISELLDENDLLQLQEYGALCSKDYLLQERSASQISDMFGVSETMLKLLMTYLGVNAINIPDFLEAMDRPEVSAVISLSGGLSSEDKEKLAFYGSLVRSILADQTYSAEEMAELIRSVMAGSGEESGEDPTITGYIGLAYELYFSEIRYDETWKLSIDEAFAQLLNSETFSPFLDEDTKKTLGLVEIGLAAGKRQLVGDTHSLFVIDYFLPEKEADAMRFAENLDGVCGEELSGSYYLIGSTPMAYEMSKTFRAELDKITLITAAAIFLVVLITFRNFFIPLILVLLIQCSVYITMQVMNLLGVDMNYLALLIVQSLLMGATIDYAIVFTNFYIEKREDRPVKEALASAFQASIRTILTSGMIMIFVTWIMGYVFADPSVGQICHIISIGVASALIMILCFLPGILAVCDRLVVRRSG